MPSNGGFPSRKEKCFNSSRFFNLSRIYKSVLPEDEYDDILRHVYESRGMIESFPRRRKKKSTIH